MISCSDTKTRFYMRPESDLCNCRIIHENVVLAARGRSLPELETNQAVDLFKALGDQTRFSILFALEKDEMCVCDLAALLGVSESAVSHQLRLLRNLRLVANRRQGPVLYYRLVDDHVRLLIDMALDHIRE